MTTRARNELNVKEGRVLSQFVKPGRPTPKTIAELAKACWPGGRGMTAVRANSWVRNSLRRLVVAALVEQVERGTYQITDLGREAAKKSLV